MRDVRGGNKWNGQGGAARRAAMGPALLATAGVALAGGCGARTGLDEQGVSEVAPVAPLSPPVALTAGLSHTCALFADGTVRCWGDNGFGQLSGSTPSSGRPLPVAGLVDATAIAAGSWHTCALRAGGAMTCWGENRWGELGGGTVSGPDHCSPPNFPGNWACSRRPVPVAGLAGIAVAMAPGEDFTCALLGDGAVECWGWNAAGELGNGTDMGGVTCEGYRECDTTPGMVLGLRQATAIRGANGTCAVLLDGTIDCWGDTYTDGNQTSPSPLAVNGLSGIKAIAMGGSAQFAFECVLLSDATVSCWGDGGFGQLGNGAPSGPYQVTGTVSPVHGLHGVTALAAGQYHACALLVDQTVACWGLYVLGGPGRSVPLTLMAPTSIANLGGVTAIAAGGNHTCALLAGGDVKCWGSNPSGELGDGTTNDSATPVSVVW